MALLFAVVQNAALGSTVVTHPFLGVTRYHRVEGSPRLLVMEVIEINLSAPGIGFAVTPGNGAKPGDTTRQRTSDFVAELGAQIGINGTFYTSAGSGVGAGGQTEYYADLSYFAYSEGNPVSTWSGSGDPDERGVNIAPNKVATFIKPYAINQANYETRPVGAVLGNAIGSYDGILIGNTITATDMNLHPRTAIGINGNKTRLFLFVVDGRWPGYSEGMTTVEVAQLLQNDYGVTDAINLDGGGSTTLVMANPNVHVVNAPSDGTERLQGCNLAVFAATPQAPEIDPGSLQSLSDGTFRFTLSGDVGAYYEVQYSSDLGSWGSLGVITMTNASVVCTDTNTGNARRFYRARVAP